jgi:transposase-like protein
VSKLDHPLEPKPDSVRRLEVITGTGRRRRFPAEKARIIDATLAPGAVLSDVARRHGLTPQQLFTWRRQTRRRQVTSAAETALRYGFRREICEPFPSTGRRRRRQVPPRSLDRGRRPCEPISLGLLASPLEILGRSIVTRRRRNRLS